MVAPNLAQVCTEVSAQCPVESSIYGYYPSLPANAFFLAWFAVFTAANLGLGIRYKTWTYMIALTLGCLTEVIGYAGRILLHSNPYKKAGFDMQIVCLIIAPAFVAAAIYLTLKHMTLCFGAEYSRLRPMYYTWIFISCDILSLILQGAGGGLAATSTTDYKKQKDGNDLMLAGIVFQVATLLVFAVLTIDYFLRLARSKPVFSKEAKTIREKTTFKTFMVGLIFAFLAVFARCVFRIAEMAPGWRNSIMRNETDFIALDGAMIAFAVCLLTIFHPGYCFPRLGNTIGRDTETELEKRSDRTDSSEVMA